MPAPWRLLREGPSDGAANMARDEALLVSAGRGAPTTLRFYTWKPAALSLGAHQPSADADLRACRRRGIDIVRRPTGGGAVLHDQEITYSIAGRMGEAPFPSSVIGVYERISTALVAGLKLLGAPAVASAATRRTRAPADCFARASSREILVSGRKLAGSAQVRRGRCFLQHGSILIAFDSSRLAEVLPGGAGPGTEAERMGIGREAGPASLSEVLSGVEVSAILEALLKGFREALGVRIEDGALDGTEAEDAARLRAFKYLDLRWTLEGRVRAQNGSD